MKDILEHIEKLDSVKPAKFDGNIFKFVEWAETSEAGKALKLNLNYRR